MIPPGTQGPLLASIVIFIALVLAISTVGLSEMEATKQGGGILQTIVTDEPHQVERQQHMFECEGLPVQSCAYAWPSRFFDKEEKGGGWEYRDMLLRYRKLEEQSKFLRTNYIDIRYNITTSASGSDGAWTGPDYEAEWHNDNELKDHRGGKIPNHMVYLHLHKVGGSYVKRVCAARRRIDKNFVFDTYYNKAQRHMGKEVGRQKLRSLMVEIRDEQKIDDPGVGVVFTFVRDPLERFVSSIGEVKHQGKLGNCTKLIGKELYECGIKRVQDMGTESNIHFKPQIMEIYDILSGIDLRVSLLPMHRLGEFAGKGCLDLSQEAQDPKRKHSWVVDPMSYFDDVMRKEVCQIYAADVTFLSSVGIPSLGCNMTR